MNLAWLRQWRSKPAPPDFNTATSTDIYYCYRLLLNREPDEAGWQYWQQMVNQYKVPLPLLVAGFANGSEFKQLQNRLNQPQLVELSKFKMMVRLNDFFIGATIARERAYEPAVTQELSRWLQPGDTFVDIGANIGYFSLLAAHLVGPSGAVYSFEPNPDNCALLRQSLAENGFEQVTLYPYAVAETAVTLFFSDGGADSNGRLLQNHEVRDPNNGRQVQCVRLDDALPPLPQLKLIKMDIEGAEPRAWQGMQQTLKQHRPILIFEFSPELIQATSQCQASDFLTQVANLYDLFVLYRDGRKSPTPQSSAQILAELSTSGLTHFDLVGYPRS